MKCHRCKGIIPDGEENDLHGQILCEDCYMDLLSPPKMCDPWAVHSAKSFGKNKNGLEVNPVQQKIIDTLKDKGLQDPKSLAEILQIKESDLERELAALRHMEKVRGELKDGKRMIRLW